MEPKLVANANIMLAVVVAVVIIADVTTNDNNYVVTTEELNIRLKKNGKKVLSLTVFLKRSVFHLSQIS